MNPRKLTKDDVDYLEAFQATKIDREYVRAVNNLIPLAVNNTDALGLKNDLAWTRNYLSEMDRLKREHGLIA